MNPHPALHDAEGLEREPPLDREAHRRLAKAVLAWTGDPGLRPAELQDIALRLTTAARALADDVRRAAERLHDEHPARALADVVLTETDRRLAVGSQGTVRCAQGRARLVRALAERLDRLSGA